MYDKGEQIKKRLVKILETRPEGLTIQELSGIIGVHRQTVTKYVLVLEAKGVIHRRRVGSATLHYLKKMFIKSPRKRLKKR